MKMRLVLSLLLSLAMTPALAAELNCPDAAGAVKVGECPSDSELSLTFASYCSADERMRDKDSIVCTDFELYRKIKNIALWEAGDGTFHAYLSCDLKPETIKAAKLTGIKLAKDNKINRVICTYGDGVAFTHRTRTECKIATEVCGPDPASCKAVCE
jgi:hypothetical protein